MLEYPIRLNFTNSNFASRTIKERWPVILSQLADSLYRNRSYYELELQISPDAVKSITGAIAQLRYEISTDKTVRLFEQYDSVGEHCDDLDKWNRYVSSYVHASDKDNEPPTFVAWHSLPWLFAECYLYRRIIESLAASGSLTFDPFAVKKQAGFHNNKRIISTFLNYLSDVLSDFRLEDNASNLKMFFEASLWANEFDLSLHPDMKSSSIESELKAYLESVRERIVVNDIDALQDFWFKRRQAVRMVKNSEDCTQAVCIVLDNAGPELAADLCLGEFLLAKQLADRIIFLPKRWPWFVSDVTQCDITWLLNSTDGLSSVGQIGTVWANKWLSRFADGTFSTYVSNFWTLPCGYADMKMEDPILYTKLASSFAIIFKGDLNYRKLLDDRTWQPDSTEHKVEAFRQLQFGRPRDGVACPCPTTSHLGEAMDCRCSLTPANGSFPPLVVTLRIAKADVAVGLTPSTWRRLCEQSVDWWISGRFGFVQLVSPLHLHQ